MGKKQRGGKQVTWIAGDVLECLCLQACSIAALRVHKISINAHSSNNSMWVAKLTCAHSAIISRLHHQCGLHRLFLVEYLVSVICLEELTFFYLCAVHRKLFFVPLVLHFKFRQLHGPFWQIIKKTRLDFKAAAAAVIVLFLFHSDVPLLDKTISLWKGAQTGIGFQLLFESHPLLQCSQRISKIVKS